MIRIIIRPLLIFCSILVFLGNLLRIRSNSWLGLWLGMEINLFGFLIIINPEGCCVAQCSVKYFVTQRVGSMLLLFGFFLTFRISNILGVVLIVCSLLIKAGVFPFHRWVPDVVMSSRWLIGCLILTWQKLAPFSFFSFFPNSFYLVVRLTIIVFIGCFGGLNQHSVRGIAVYSSFVHNSWMILSLLYSFSVFFIYYLVYSLSVVIFFISCWLSRKRNLIRYSISWLGMSSLLMLSGVPPFMGFFVKLIVVLSCPVLLLSSCLLGSIIRLKFYISFFYRIILNRSVSDFYPNRSSSLFGVFCLLNFLLGLVSARFYIW